MLDAKCPQCGQTYRGFALANTEYQTCEKCGVALEITDGDHTFTGYAPFTAKDLPPDSK
jgi:uncharacterized protein (DUF983 family)